MSIFFTIIGALLSAGITVSQTLPFNINVVLIGTVLFMMYKKYTPAFVWVLVGGVIYDLYTPTFFGAELIPLVIMSIALYPLTTHYDQHRIIHNIVLALVASITYYGALGLLTLITYTNILRPIEQFSGDFVNVCISTVLMVFISIIIIRSIMPRWIK